MNYHYQSYIDVTAVLLINCRCASDNNN